MSAKDRREFLEKMGLAGVLSAMAPAVFGQAASGAFTVDPANTSTPEIKPEHSIRFAAIGLDHAHIFGMVSAIQRGGGTLVAFHAIKNVQLPFGPQFVADVVNRTNVAQDQEQALLAAELVLKAQTIATRPIQG